MAMESSPTSNGSSSSVTVSHVHVKAQMPHSASDDALDHILQYMGRSSSSCHDNNNSHDTKPPPPPAMQLDHHHHHPAACPGSSSFYGMFMKLPHLEHAEAAGLLPNPSKAEYAADASGIADWDSLDRIAAYELDGLSDASKNMVAFFDDASAPGFSSVHAAAGDGDLWSLARSSVSSLHADLTMNNV
jgi:hypothetical protein